jgi:Tol biopolymer transport system component
VIPTPTQDLTGKIAFTSNRDGNFEIYLMNQDGSGLTRLTDDPGEDARPAWSPEGTRIAFESNRNGNFQIYVMNADGTNLNPLTDGSSSAMSPAWSPDGTRISFASDRDGNWEIYVMPAPGPEGNSGGSVPVNLTNNPSQDFSHTWSPDGSRIAFDTTRDDPDPENCYPSCLYEIYVMNADGSGATNLTKNAVEDYDPAWSPDRNRIAFASGRDDNWELYVMSANGSGATRLTSEPSADDEPAWSPDGSRIAFVSLRDGNPEIYVMNANGSGLIRLTDNPAEDWDPAWSPR